MGLGEFEQKLERMVSGLFARAFRSAVQPVEIAAALQREVDQEAQVISRDRHLVPNDFVVRLAPSDIERLREYDAAMADELARQLKDHARTQGYVFPGPVSISFDADPALTTGRLQVESAAKASVTSRNQPGQAGTQTSAYAEINGQRHPLAPPGLVIGRGSDADLKINDPGISRRHAELVVRLIDGETVVGVRDLGSTNGLMVDGVKTTQTRLYDGSEVTVGSTTLTITFDQAPLPPGGPA